MFALILHVVGQQYCLPFPNNMASSFIPETCPSPLWIKCIMDEVMNSIFFDIFVCPLSLFVCAYLFVHAHVDFGGMFNHVSLDLLWSILQPFWVPLSGFGRVN